MIHHIKGNILTSDCNVIIHQSNCMGGFGSGIAGQIRKEYPLVYEAFKADNRSPENKLGDYSSAFDKHYLFFNLYGQMYYGGKPGIVYTDYEAFEKGLNAVLSSFVPMFSVKYNKIGMPYKIGCGLAGGDWNIVYSIIEKCSIKHGVDIWLYEYNP